MSCDNTDDQYYVLLGNPPWNECLLERLYFQDFKKTREYIQRHPGYPIHAELEAIRLSLDVFLNAVSDLISSINRFKAESNQPGFWYPSRRHSSEELQIAIQRGIASSAMCAMTLVDHSRRFAKHHPIPEYSQQVEKYFRNSQEHIFVQNFRNRVAHFALSRANWMSTASREEGRKTFFLLNCDDLLKYNDWQALSKIYIAEHPDGIDVEQLFQDYSAKVTEFHNWMRSAIFDEYGERISGYMHYSRLLTRVEARSHWQIILQQFIIPQRRDPYIYLEKYLDRRELEAVFALPYRSVAQVDCIINLIDEYGACTDDIRQLVYQSFGIDSKRDKA
jgi:hypothetical protein